MRILESCVALRKRTSTRLPVAVEESIAKPAAGEVDTSVSVPLDRRTTIEPPTESYCCCTGPVGVLAEVVGASVVAVVLLVLPPSLVDGLLPLLLDPVRTHTRWCVPLLRAEPATAVMTGAQLLLTVTAESWLLDTPNILAVPSLLLRAPVVRLTGPDQLQVESAC